ncbi:MAG: LLM class flavin-dependent oxidoreductase [SAR202 cluster bacterium]|nr:LLM class flavin-dependent oxidoreductase [SAR202 cluster bacterium]|tara:strand:- start:5317 stop:6204 length:888 start_codon:yes stop_codon:yes gene_type:complete
MEIGIALPKLIPANKGDIVVDWAIRADEGPFSSLAQIDRLVYGNHDVLTVMAAAAAVTSRVRLMPTVLVAPLRNAAIMAKQVSSIDSISGGRFVLGIGVGSRPDDFAASGAEMKNRGRHMEQQIEEMRKIWSGESVREGVGPIGPTYSRKSGPELLIGGRSEAALRRSGRLGDGYVAGSAGSSPSNQAKEVLEYFAVVEDAWKEAGKPGRPRLVAGLTCAWGKYAADRTADSIRSYYSFRGDAARRMNVLVPSDDKSLTEAFRAYEEIGCDELVLEPGIGDLEQIDRLADFVARY